MSCETYNCKREAVFKTTRMTKDGAKYWCSQCCAEKAAKYEMVIERIKFHK